MRDIFSLLLTIVGCVIFIQLLPTLLWLFVIIMIAAFVYTTYQRYKYNQYQKEIHENTNQTYTRSNSYDNTVNPDVIDVEFSEREEDIS